MSPCRLFSENRQIVEAVTLGDLLTSFRFDLSETGAAFDEAAIESMPGVREVKLARPAPEASLITRFAEARAPAVEGLVPGRAVRS